MTEPVDMTIDDAIQAFRTAGHTLPRAAMQWCLDHWTEAAPALVRVTPGLRRADAGPRVRGPPRFAVVREHHARAGAGELVGDRRAEQTAADHEDVGSGHGLSVWRTFADRSDAAD